MTTLLGYINALKWFALILFVMVFFRSQVVGILDRLTTFKVSVGAAQFEVDSSAPTATTTSAGAAKAANMVDLSNPSKVATFHKANYVARPSQSKLEVRVARWIAMDGNLFVEFEALNQTGSALANLIATASLKIGDVSFDNIHIAFPGVVPTGGTAFQIAYVSDSAKIDEGAELPLNLTSTSRYSIVS